ncbi:MAG: integral membrane-like protein [Ignavibacteriales bacterium]
MKKAAGVIGLVALALMAPALIHGAPTADSGSYNYIWTSQIAEEMARGVLYPRWLPRSFEGLGAPTFYFYPPLAYWIAGLLAQVMDAGRALGAAAFVLLYASGLAMYAWLKPRTPYALVGACLYMLAPYHVADFYVRSALAEFGAFAWLPLIALGIDRVDRRSGPPLLAVAYAGLLCTHLPTALLASALLIPPLVIWRCRLQPALLVRCGLAGVAGVLLAAFYLAPALTLQDQTLMQPLLWGHRFDPLPNSALGFFINPHPWLVITTEIGAAWALIAVVALMAPRTNRLWPILTLATVACAMGLIPLLWLPFLRKIQFPWRALEIVEFVGVTTIALGLSRPLVLAIVAGFAVQALVPFSDAALRHEPMPPYLTAHQVDALEYLPAEFRPVPQTRSPPDLSHLAGPLVQGAVQTGAGPDGSVSLRATADGPVTIRRAKFPRWQVSGPRGPAPLLPGPLVSFEARAGESYRLAPVRTPAEAAGLWLSLIGLVLTAALWRFGTMPAREPFSG